MDFRSTNLQTHTRGNEAFGYLSTKNEGKKMFRSGSGKTQNFHRDECRLINENRQTSVILMNICMSAANVWSVVGSLFPFKGVALWVTSVCVCHDLGFDFIVSCFILVVLSSRVRSAFVFPVLSCFPSCFDCPCCFHLCLVSSCVCRPWLRLKSLKLHPRFLHLRPFLAS